MPKGHTEKLKKKTVKMMVKGHLTQKETAKKVGVTETAIGYWVDRYFYEVMEELAEEKRQRKRMAAAKEKKEVIWHQVNSIAGYWG